MSDRHYFNMHNPQCPYFVPISNGFVMYSGGNPDRAIVEVESNKLKGTGMGVDKEYLQELLLKAFYAKPL